MLLACFAWSLGAASCDEQLQHVAFLCRAALARTARR